MPSFIFLQRKTSNESVRACQVSFALALLYFSKQFRLRLVALCVCADFELNQRLALFRLRFFWFLIRFSILLDPKCLSLPLKTTTTVSVRSVSRPDQKKWFCSNSTKKGELEGSKVDSRNQKKESKQTAFLLIEKSGKKVHWLRSYTTKTTKERTNVKTINNRRSSSKHLSFDECCNFLFIFFLWISFGQLCFLSFLKIFINVWNGEF